MQLAEFDFELPKELIAQSATKERDQSNLLITTNGQKNIIKFHQLIDQLNFGDMLVFNDSKVINASFALQKNASSINVNLNKPVNYTDKQIIWLGFAKPARKLAVGDKFQFDKHHIIVKNKYETGDIEFEFCLDGLNLFEFLDIYGQVPLPNYIKRAENSLKNDSVRYQTIYAKNKGSVAASTAGLHFSSSLLAALQAKGVQTEFVTLHIGAGTFLPVKTKNIMDHKMHSEWCHISAKTAANINQAKAEGRQIIAVGTTALRVLESCAHDGQVKARTLETDLFITPGYEFQIVDSLITNFHLPKSTLLMLVSAFAGMEEIRSLYQYAIAKKIRFFSYGDAMLLRKKEENSTQLN